MANNTSISDFVDKIIGVEAEVFVRGMDGDSYSAKEFEKKYEEYSDVTEPAIVDTTAEDAREQIADYISVHAVDLFKPGRFMHAKRDGDDVGFNVVNKDRQMQLELELVPDFESLEPVVSGGRDITFIDTGSSNSGTSYEDDGFGLW